MPVFGVGGGARSPLVEKAQSNQTKNSLARTATPLANASSQQLGAQDSVALARPVLAQAASQLKEAKGTAPQVGNALRVKA